MKQLFLFVFFVFAVLTNAQPIPKSIDKPVKTKPKKETAPKIVVKQIPIYIEKTNDRDGDGLTDAIDECPDKKGTPKNGGCPELVQTKTSKVKKEPETILKKDKVMSAEDEFQYALVEKKNGKNELAFAFFLKAANKGHSDAQNVLGSCYENGIGVDKNEEEAAKWYNKAANQGNAEAQYNLGVCYMLKIGVNQNHTLYCEWMLKSANQGFSRAQGEIGSYLLNSSREKEELSWLIKAANQGDVNSQRTLGKHYYIEGERSEAIKCYKMAANNGDNAAKKELEYIMSLGH